MIKKISLKTITFIALFSAFIFVSSRLEIRISGTRIHFGNTMCLLSSLILTPITSGLSAGIGSLLFDLVFYPSDIPLDFIITFFTKFILSFVSSFIFHKIFHASKSTIYILISCILGQISYIFLYLLKTYIQNKYILSLAKEIIYANITLRLGTSSFNALIAIIFSTIIYKSIYKYIKFNIYE